MVKYFSEYRKLIGTCESTHMFSTSDLVGHTLSMLGALYSLFNHGLQWLYLNKLIP
jgi:hypothetical protein